KWLTGGLIAQAVVIALLAIGAFVAGPFAAAQSREKTPTATAALSLASVDLVQPGMRRYGLVNDNHRIKTLAWVDDGHAVIARTRGQRETLADGAAGLLSIDISAQTVLSLSAPALNIQAKQNGLGMVNGYFTGTLKQGLPLFAQSDRPNTAVLLVQAWN